MAWTFDEKSPIYLQIAYRVKLKIASKELSMGHPSDHADDNKNGKPNGDPKKDLLQMRQSRCCVVSHSSRSRMCPKGLSARNMCLSLITFSHI